MNCFMSHQKFFVCEFDKNVLSYTSKEGAVVVEAQCSI